MAYSFGDLDEQFSSPMKLNKWFRHFWLGLSQKFLNFQYKRSYKTSFGNILINSIMFLMVLYCFKKLVWPESGKVSKGKLGIKVLQELVSDEIMDSAVVLKSQIAQSWAMEMD